MKKLLAIAVASVALASVAAYTPTTVGVTAVTTTSKNTIVAVPYTAIATGSAIAVKDLVKAANLPNGTFLYVYNGSSYYAWQSDKDAGTWTGVTTVSTVDGVSVAQGTDSVTLATGSALWVVLPETPASSQTIYVYGNAALEATESAVAGGTTLVANPTSSKAAIGVTTAALNDEILIPNGSGDFDRYTYKSSKSTGTSSWRKDGVVASLPSIDAGRGFWYVRAANAGSATITWTAVVGE